jgi:hypothetical protein
MSLGIEVLEAPGTTGDYRTLFHKCVAVFVCCCICCCIMEDLGLPPLAGQVVHPDHHQLLPFPPSHPLPGRLFCCRKAEAIAGALSGRGFQFGFLHVKAVDDTGHDHLTQLKVGARVGRWG